MFYMAANVQHSVNELTFPNPHCKDSAGIKADVSSGGTHCRQCGISVISVPISSLKALPEEMSQGSLQTSREGQTVLCPSYVGLIVVE